MHRSVQQKACITDPGQISCHNFIRHLATKAGILTMHDARIPTYPKHIASAVVTRIKRHVHTMLGHSSVVKGRWDEKDDTCGIFEKDEVKIGKLLGSGGFSDVYEVINFELKEDPVAKYGNSQIAARRFYEENAVKNGKCKYVAKHLRLKTMEDPTKFCLAAADLVVEAQFLNSLHHENILKIRGWTTGGINAYADGSHNGYFLLLDRLNETLDDRIAFWNKRNLDDSLERSLERLGLNSGNTSELLSRTRIAHQIASALAYLHSKNIVFRDLKPNNVGFDEHGTVKIFDFGLSRELPRRCDNVNDVYTMSGAIGTVRYMAPEVALSRQYNQKVDTYSWSMLYWSCITLEKPYASMSRSVHRSNVCICGHRPALPGDLPDTIKHLLQNSWLHSINARFTMTEVCTLLKRIEKELETNLERTRSNSSLTMSRPLLYVRNSSNAAVSVAA